MRTNCVEEAISIFFPTAVLVLVIVLPRCLDDLVDFFMLSSGLFKTCATSSTPYNLHYDAILKSSGNLTPYYHSPLGVSLIRSLETNAHS